MLSQLLQPEIKSLIEMRQFGTLKEILEDWTPTDIADLFYYLDDKERVILFRLLHTEIAADTFEYLDIDTQMELLKTMGNEEVANILNEMDPDDRTALFEELPAAAAKRLIQLLSPEERKVALSLLGYPENSVGRLMTPDYVAVKPGWTIKEALDYIREYGKNKETLNVVYVVDDKGELVDDIKIREFLLAPLDSKVAELMDENFVAINVFDDQEKTVSVLKKYDRVALPVIDNAGILLGIVTVDDIMDVAEEETTEDIQKQAAVGVLEEPYSDISVIKMFKKRVGWLSILFVGQMFTATAMAYFEDAIEKAVVLALFVPLIISSGGNSGSQAASLVVRAMALGEITIGDWFSVFKRELFTGFSLGLMLAIIGFIRFTFFQAPKSGFENYWILITLTVSFSLVGVVLWGTIVGSMLPFLMKKLNFDPAASSTPFVATMVDVTGILIYFSIAMILLKDLVM